MHKMSNPAKNKGSGYERKIAEYLTSMVGKEFKKCPGSGAIGTISGIPGLQGDVIRADLKEIPYIECKKYKDFRFENFLLQQGDEWNWVKQTLGNLTKQAGRNWCIIFQKDYGRHHWCLTNIPIESIPHFELVAGLGQRYVLTTLEVALRDPKFKERFNG